MREECLRDGDERGEYDVRREYDGAVGVVHRAGRAAHSALGNAATEPATPVALHCHRRPTLLCLRHATLI